MAELLPDRYRPPQKPKFQWLGDPADRFRGKNKANITGADAASMLAYNQSLYEDIDRGGKTAIRIDGVPLAGTAAPAIPMTKEGIERQYGGGRPGIVSLRTPVSVATAGASPAGAHNDVNTGGDPARIFLRDTLGATAQNFAHDAFQQPSTPAVTPSPVSTPIPPSLNPVVPVDSPMLGQSVSGPAFDPQGNPFPPSGAEKPPVTTLHGTDPSVGAALTGEESARAAIMGQKPSPTQDEADRRAEWTARGGSDATYHRKQVKEGRRAPIDARATVSPLNSTASQDIQKKWGWGGQRGLPY